jgi:phenylacetate-CoA ligase
MSYLNRVLIKASMKLWGRDDIEYYKIFMQEANLPLEVLQERQLIQFKELFVYAKNTFPYYDNLFSKLKLHQKDFKNLYDLYKIPILTKNDIVNNYQGFIPRKSTGRYIWSSTGGSTGTPLKYRLSQECNSRAWALEWRGYSHAGFNIGDKLVVFGGGSLVRNDIDLKSKLRTKILNNVKLSSYGMSENDLNHFYKTIYKSKAQYIYGYPSSISLLANFILSNHLIFDHKFKGIFCTAEMLTPAFRMSIEQGFKCKVFDDYGIIDGGISAHEDHRGLMQIDTERAILEVVDSNNFSVADQSGKILATSLYNFSFPFIRYDSGDIGTITSKFCTNENPRLVLSSLLGRTTDYIELNGKIVGSPVLTVLMSNIAAFRYQFIQRDNSSLELRIHKTESYTQQQEEFIIKSIRSNLGENFNFNIIYGNDFEESDNKHKFILNRCKSKL